MTPPGLSPPWHRSAGSHPKCPPVVKEAHRRELLQRRGGIALLYLAFSNGCQDPQAPPLPPKLPAQDRGTGANDMSPVGRRGKLACCPPLPPGVGPWVLLGRGVGASVLALTALKIAGQHGQDSGN